MNSKQEKELWILSLNEFRNKVIGGLLKKYSEMDSQASSDKTEEITENQETAVEEEITVVSLIIGVDL